MIKYNDNTINDWNFGDDNIIKVYRNNAVCYYKIDLSSPSGQTPCFAVVEDISQYSDTEFEDVFNQTDGLWYKLNNLNQYEEYGVYGDSISSGGTSRLPDGYTEVEYIENTQNGKACIDTNYIPNQDTRILCSYQSTYNSQYGRIWGSGTNTKTNAIMINYEGGVTYQLRVKWAKGSNWTTTSVYGDYNVHTYDFNKNNLYFDGTLVSTTSYTTFQSSDNIALFAYINNGTPPFSSQYQEFAWGKMFYCKIYDNDILVRDFVPCIRDNDSVAGMYDLVNNVFYPPVNYTSYQFVAGSAVDAAATYYEGKLAIVDGYEYMYSGSSWVNVGEVSGGQTEYPVYYDEIQDPPDNLSFSSMTEAESYECPWVGMKATIDGDKYVFSGDSQSGYEWVEQTLPYDAEIEYLESTGTQYINTNIYLNTSSFEIGYNILGNLIKWGYTHQGRGGGTWITVEASTAFFGNYNNGRVSITTDNTENVVTFASTSGITVNGVSYSKTFQLGSDSIASIPLYVFGRYDFRNGMDYDSSGKVKSFYIKNNGVLVLDMIPVRVGQVGYMYDRVSGELFGNAGTGSFILGTDKN